MASKLVPFAVLGVAMLGDAPRLAHGILLVIGVVSIVTDGVVSIVTDGVGWFVTGDGRKVRRELKAADGWDFGIVNQVD